MKKNRKAKRMLQSLRLFKDKSGIFTDVSIENQEYGSTLLPELSATDFLYVAQPFPFNNFFNWIKTPNSTSCKLKIEYWDGVSWRMMADTLDETSVGGKALARSGSVIFSPDPLHLWSCIDDSSKITEINSVRIYNSYWIRISTDNALDPLCALNELSYCFASSGKINDFDIEVETYIDEFEAGKTDWTKEMIMASKEVVKDLKRFGIVANRGQILDIDDVSTATVYKALMIIYRHLGKSFSEKLLSAQKEYERAMSFKSFTVDKNKNAIIDVEEKNPRQNRLVR